MTPRFFAVVRTVHADKRLAHTAESSEIKRRPLAKSRNTAASEWRLDNLDLPVIEAHGFIQTARLDIRRFCVSE